MTEQSIINDIWQIVQPLVVLFVSIVGPVLVTWISSRVLAVLKVQDEKQKLEIEAKLREALHQSALNALKYAVTKTGVPLGVIGGAGGVTIDAAADYVRQKNPEALAKLGVSSDALKEIIMSKVPDVAGVNRNG